MKIISSKNVQKCESEGEGKKQRQKQGKKCEILKARGQNANKSPPY